MISVVVNVYDKRFAGVIRGHMYKVPHFEGVDTDIDTTWWIYALLILCKYSTIITGVWITSMDRNMLM